jgi:hypothetical protein
MKSRPLFRFVFSLKVQRSLLLKGPMKDTFRLMVRYVWLLVVGAPGGCFRLSVCFGVFHPKMGGGGQERGGERERESTHCFCRDAKRGVVLPKRDESAPTDLAERPSTRRPARPKTKVRKREKRHAVQSHCAAAVPFAAASGSDDGGGARSLSPALARHPLSLPFSVS